MGEFQLPECVKFDSFPLPFLKQFSPNLFLLFPLFPLFSFVSLFSLENDFPSFSSGDSLLSLLLFSTFFPI
ncbi:MAG: hypothetical protein C6I01_00010 [Epsilonproteobacteria bacterium]|nr:hypothetical protein [Campylobacterota bacterium]